MTAPATLSPLDVAAGQLEAYNRQDLDAHCAFFADDVVVADLNGDVTLQGKDAYRAKYQQVFADFPKNRAELVNRICVGDTVIDHERVFRDGVTEAFQVIAIYTLAGGRIARVDFRK
ncbi:nuclear transport factor 2 family protein [Phenylobacterium sp.]|uniref:nuclear transport factor 2 family protein n=1 Tax=Phenylobacterium sp. TaxID=1871053 RepID=UPI0025DDD086|nr:nuclear transport factor 2 family protein [Phenylobacterium sp.]